MQKLTEEQKEYFSKCPQVESFTEYYVFFKKEFKDEFYKHYCDGMKPRAIFEMYGIDVNILTVNKMNGFRCKLLQTVRANGGNVPEKRHRGRKPSEPNNLDNSDNSVSDNGNLEKNFKKAVKKIQELESIIRYKDQELTFLKKITSTTTRKEHLCSET